MTEVAELRKTIYEAMRLLTRSKTGREYLRQEKIYSVPSYPQTLNREGSYLRLIDLCITQL